MTDDALEHAKAAFLQGTAHFTEQRYAAAEEAFERALALAPGRASVLLNLGVARLHLGQPAAALAPLQAAVVALQDASDAWSALALAHHQLEHWADSARSHARARALGADSAAVRLRHAESVARQGLWLQAAELYAQSLALDDTQVDAWSQRGDALREAGQREDAAHCYRQAMALGADPELHQYYLAALQADAPIVAAPRQYVQALFDGYADDFEAHLVDQLGYQGHRLLIEHLPAACPPWAARVLDLGCGTGLCGPLLRPRAGHLTGVDLSPAMLQKAWDRGLYDALHAQDIHDHLRAPGEFYDLIVAADVFIYVGPLEPVFALLAHRLAPQGWLAFTVEDAGAGADSGAQSGVRLLPSLRYAHSESYLRHLAQTHGLSVQHLHDAPIRYHQGQPVAGRYMYLQKSR